MLQWSAIYLNLNQYSPKWLGASDLYSPKYKTTRQIFCELNTLLYLQKNILENIFDYVLTEMHLFNVLYLCSDITL